MPAPNAPTTRPNGGRQQTREQEKQTMAPKHPIHHSSTGHNHRPTGEKDTTQLTTRPRSRGRQPAMGRGMPSPRPRRPQTSRASTNMPAAYTAPGTRPGDAKPPTKTTPELPHRRKETGSLFRTHERAGGCQAVVEPSVAPKIPKSLRD